MAMVDHWQKPLGNCITTSHLGIVCKNTNYATNHVLVKELDDAIMCLVV